MNRSLPILLAAALVAAGCSAKAKKPEPEAKAERPAVEFTHAPHQENGVECSTCHAGIEKATSLRERHLPDSKVCADCHEGYDAPKPGAPEPRISFSHAGHLPLVQNKCETCHKKLPEMGEPRYVPPMETCTNCHNHQQDFTQGRCRPCHVDLKGYFPTKAYSHGGDWLRLHGPAARPSAESCASCHDQTYCAECHASTTTAARPSVIYPEEVQRDFIHRGDYVSRHYVEAGADPASCRRCHGQKFCEACHTLQNATRLAPGNSLRQPDSHERPGFVNDRTSGNFHGDHARRNVNSCASCHDQGRSSVCVACHAEGGVGGNPHPRSWTKRHDLDDVNENGVCRACHRS